MEKQNKIPFSDALLQQACKESSVADLSCATIGETVLVAQWLEKETGEPFIRMDQGSPGLPANVYGLQAEKEALDTGIASQYPAAGGIQELKEAGSEFIKAFINVNITPRSIIPTTGSVAASFGSFIGCCQRIPGKNKVLFLDPGFPIQKSQLRIMGLEWKSFDIAPYRGAALKARIEEELKDGTVAAMIYSNPNNPAWTCLEEEELKGIGELATKYDVVIMEDLAYFCMDYRKDLSQPYKAPFLPTVARYTDKYILMLSSSKIFSYAGQRIALCAISDKLFETKYEALAQRYHDAGIFGQTLCASILYMITSGCTSTTQIGYARMLQLSCQGKINFVEDTREYERRAEAMKSCFKKNGFHISYDKDVTAEVGNGFFYTIGYKNMSGEELVVELIRYGISSISLGTTGAKRPGIRACVSRFKMEQLPLLEARLAQFAADHNK